MEQEFEYDVYMLCPVRNATDEEKEFLENYKSKLEEKGFKVLYPATDTPQEDPSGGYDLVMTHCDEILNSRTVHVYWNEKSEGSKVDLGKSLMEHRRRGLEVILVNREHVKGLVGEQKQKGLKKSYEMVLAQLDDKSKNSYTRLND